MAGNDALLASLLLGQRQRRDPLEIYQSFGRGMSQAGSSTAPLGSGNALEGIARALQGGLGGFMQGYALKRQDDRDDATRQSLADLVGAKTQEDIQAIASRKGTDSAVLAPLLGQLAMQQQARIQNGMKAENFVSAFGGGPTPSGTGPQIANTPQQPGPLSTASLPPGVFSNNSGNIRATPLPWEGKGAPQGGFETFGTPQAGANAQFQNFAAYVKANPNITVAQALTKWAPPNENDTGNYIKSISEASGINPGMPLSEVLQDPMVAARLLDAQTRLEKGGMPQGFSADTFIAAAGGPQAGAPPSAGQPGPIAAPPTQVAQGDILPSNGTGTPNATPSATSGPPDVPRPQPTQQQLQKYKDLIASGQLTGQQAVQELDKEVTQEWQARRQQSIETWKDQQTSKRQNEKAAIDLGQKAPMEMISKRVDAYEKDIRPRGEAAVSEINSIHQVRQLLDAGVFTGTGAEAQAAGSRVAQALGIDWGADRQANTAALQSAVGSRVLALVKNLGAGTAISNADREYAAKIAGGDIAAGEPAMRKILDIGERAARATIRSHDAEAGRVKKLPGMGQLGDDQFSLQTAPTYEEWSKANPTQKPSAPAAPAAPASQAGGGDVMQQARDAIARGAPREQVLQRLKGMGLSGEGL